MDGAAVADENFANILMDVAVLWSLNIRTVLVHGASVMIRALAAERGLTPSDLEGSGVTDAETLELALTASNRLTHEILEGLAAADLQAAVPNAVIAHPVGILEGVDHLFTGRVERVDVGLLDTLLSNGIVPVVAAPRRRRRGRHLARQLRRRGGGPGEGPGRGEAHLHDDGRRAERGRRAGAADPGDRARPGPDAGGRWRDAALEGPPRRGGVRGRRAAGARDQRPRGRRPARRGLLERGNRDPGLRQRVPGDPARAPERRAHHRAAHPHVDRDRGAGARGTGRPSRPGSTTSTSSRSTATPSPAWPSTSTPTEALGELACLYVHPSHENRGHRAEDDAVRRGPGPGEGARPAPGPLDAGVRLLPDQGRLRGGHAGRPAPDADGEPPTTRAAGGRRSW